MAAPIGRVAGRFGSKCQAVDGGFAFSGALLVRENRPFEKQHARPIETGDEPSDLECGFAGEGKGSLRHFSPNAQTERNVAIGLAIVDSNRGPMPRRDLKVLIAELKAEGRIVQAKRRWRIHPGILPPTQGAPPSASGAAEVARVWDRRGRFKNTPDVN